MPGRLTSSRFVGRHGELAELELAFREATQGHPGLVLLGGDSGVGKTRLVAEAEPSLAGALVLRGQCLEQGDGELPYAPIMGALRPVLRAQHPALAEISAGARAHLATLLPSLGEPVTRHNNMNGEGAGQVRLFEALLELIDLLSAAAPLVLVLEDMHWADSSTRTFISFLARSLHRARVLQVLTYRTDELHRRHPLRPLLAELDRLEHTRRITLEPFDRDELIEALTDILGQEPDQELVDRLLARSEGNALYIEELLAAGLDGRGAAPQSLRDAFMLRIERLTPDARLAAQAVAVGHALDQETVAAVSGASPERLREALREALTDHVLVTNEDDRFQFRHALLREAVYDDLLPGERGELHMSLARMLEQQVDDSGGDTVARVATIATHYAAAGDQPAALRAAVHAAREAGRIHAYGEVADMTERALELWPRVADPEQSAEIDHVELLEVAARAHGLVGDGSRAEVLTTRALSEVDEQHDPVRYSGLLAQLARLRWKLNRGREALEAAQHALELLPPGKETDADRAALQAWLARTRVLRGQYREAVRDGELALAAANAANEPCVAGEVLNTIGMARIAVGDVQQGEAQLREAMQIARELGDVDELGTAYCNLADLLSLAGRTSDAMAVVYEGLEETPGWLLRLHGWMEITLSMLSLESGDWDTARARPGPPPSTLAGVMLIFRHLRDAEMALAEGDEQQVAVSLAAAEPLVRVTSEAQWHGQFGALLAEHRRRAGDLDGARAAVAKALDELELCTDDVMRIARVTAIGLVVEADNAVRARDFRDADGELDALMRAQLHLSRLDAAAQEGGPVERAWHTFGIAEESRARGANDPPLWHAAALAWEQLGRPYPAAVVRWREAEALVEADDRDAAACLAADALAVAQRLGANWLAGEVQALVARARLHVDDDDDGSSAADGDDGDGEVPFGLTPRELQVLALLASGATNRQIGTSLYMAEKTASVHVSRILAKLGVQTRTQAAAVSHRLHLY